MARDVINIRNKAVCRAIRELAALKGQTLTETVEIGVRRHLDEFKSGVNGTHPPR